MQNIRYCSNYSILQHYVAKLTTPFNTQHIPQPLEQQLQVPVGKVNLILPQACQNFIKKYQKNINIDIKTMNFDIRHIMQQIDIYAQYTYDVITKYKYLDKLGVIVRSVVEGQNMILAFLANISTEYIREKSLYEKKLETLTHRIYQKCQNCEKSLENAHIMNAQDDIGLKFRDPLQYFMHDLEEINKLSEQASLIFRKKMLHIEGIQQEQYMRRLQKMYQNVTNTIQNVTSSLNNLTCFQQKFSQFQQVQYMSTRGQKQRIQKNKFDQKKYTLDLSKHFYGKMKRLEDRLAKIRSFFITLATHQTQTQNQFNQCTPEALSELKQKINKVQLQKKQVQLYISSIQQQVVDGKLKIRTQSQKYSSLKAQKDKCEQKIKDLQLELDLIKQKQERNLLMIRLSEKANENIIEQKQLKLKPQTEKESKMRKFSKKKSQIEQTLKQSIDKKNKQSSEQNNKSKENKQGQKNSYFTKRQSKVKKQSQKNLFGQKQLNGKINSSRLSKIIKEVQKQITQESEQKNQNTNKFGKRKQKPKIKILQKKPKTMQQQKINENQPITLDKSQKNNMIQSFIENNSLQNLNQQPEQKQEDNQSMSNYGQYQQEQQQLCQSDYPYMAINPMYQICVISNQIKLCEVKNINKENLIITLNILAEQQAKLKIEKDDQSKNYEELTKNIYNKLIFSKYISQNEIKYQKFKAQFDDFIKDVQNRDKKQWNSTKSLSKITEVNPNRNRNVKDEFKLEFNELENNMKKRNLLTITPKIRQQHKRVSKHFQDGCSQSQHTQILKQKNEERQKYKGMLLKTKNKTKIYTENNYDEQKQKNIKTVNKKQSKNIQESNSPYSFTLNLKKIHQMKGKLINNENYQSYSKNNSTLPSPKYMSLSKFHNQKYDLISSTDNLFSTLNSRSFLQNLPHLKKKNREKSLNVNLDKISLEQQIQFPLIINQQLIFTEHDVKMIYLSIENAIQINHFSQKHRKTLSHITAQENPLYPIELNYMKQFFTRLANVHLKNKSGYQKIKQFLLCPYDSAISQTTELAIGKLSGHHSLNSNMMRQALRSIILMHRSCNVRDELCRHLKYLLGKIVSFEANH